jgi:hypothetical protein
MPTAAGADERAWLAPEAMLRGERIARWRRFHGEPWAGSERDASAKAAKWSWQQ